MNMPIIERGLYSPENAPDALIAKAYADYLEPVHPGGVNGQVFWNVFSRQFIYAPSFDFSDVDGASAYRYTVTDGDGKTHVFTALSPREALTPVWGAIPEGETSVNVEGLDATGNVLGVSGERKFYRNVPFDNRCGAASRSYKEAALKCYKYLFTMPAIQYLKCGEPDPDYTHYCYPSKMYASIIKGMLEYVELEPSDREEAMDIAVKSADYLMRTAVGPESPLAGLPLTYMVPTTEDGKKLVAASKVGTIMMIYPPVVGLEMVNLFKATGIEKYRDYAVVIGEQLARLQREDGTWPLILNIADGAVIADNDCAPHDMLYFLHALARVTGDDRYESMARRGEDILMKRISTFHWEGQFEDIKAQVVPFSNLSKHPATDAFLYLAEQEYIEKTPEFVAQARDVQRFAEDQFVEWRRNGRDHTPVALEQFNCYWPVDASVAKMIRYYLLMFDLTGNELDLAKARALGDSMTRVQLPDSGRIPTWYDKDKYVPGGDWINCMYASAWALLKLSKY